MQQLEDPFKCDFCEQEQHVGVVAGGGAKICNHCVGSAATVMLIQRRAIASRVRYDAAVKRIESLMNLVQGLEQENAQLKGNAAEEATTAPDPPPDAG